MSGLVRFNYWAEGPTDRAAARKLIRAVGGVPGDDYSQRHGASPGKDYLDKRLAAFNASAKRIPWLVLRDADASCAVNLVNELLEEPAPLMVFRIVVPAIEAWLMADREAFASMCGVAVARIAAQPEQLTDIRSHVLDIARASRSREIRDDFLPVARSGRRVGPGYAQRLMRFADDIWAPGRASANSPSLSRAVSRLQAIVACSGQR